MVDNHSKDSTPEIASRLADHFVVAGPERSSQRNLGATMLKDIDIVGFVDSDMTLAPAVVSEVVIAIGEGADAVVVPEHTTGVGFFASVRAFEREQYVRASRVEAARFFRIELFRALGGFDETLTAGEDWDLGLRAATFGAVVRHTTSSISHDEGAVHYLAHCRKKGSYALGLQAFLTKHGRTGRQVILDRPYLKKPWRLCRHPLLATGLVTLKVGEAIAVGSALRRSARHSRVQAQ